MLILNPILKKHVNCYSKISILLSAILLHTNKTNICYFYFLMF